MKTRKSILIRLAFISTVCLLFSGCEKYEIGELEERNILTIKSSTIENEYNELIWSETFMREKGAPKLIVNEFKIPNYEAFSSNFQIILAAGNELGKFVTTSSIVEINDVVLLGPDYYPSTSVPFDTLTHPHPISIPDDPNTDKSNHPIYNNYVLTDSLILNMNSDVKVELELRGSPGDYVSIEINGKPK